MGRWKTGVHVTRRNFVRGVGLLGASAALAACMRQEEAGTGEQAAAAAPLLAIIHTNDTHGHDVEVEATDISEGSFSMAAIPKLRADWEAKGYEVLVVDCGDATQGMPLVDQSSGEAAITFMNACGYDAMGVGNQETCKPSTSTEVLQNVEGIDLFLDGHDHELVEDEVTVDATVPYERGAQYPDSTYYGPANPGACVTIHTVGGEPWSAEATYAVAMSDFLTQGGDTYHAFRDAAEASTPVTCDFDYEALSSYIMVACDHDVPEDYAGPQDRIHIAIA